MNILAGKSAYVPERQMGDMVLRRNPARHRDENPAAQDNKQVNAMMHKPLCLRLDLLMLLT